MEEGNQRQGPEVQGSEVLSLCPSFNSYTSVGFAEVAAKVSQVFSRNNDESAADDPAEAKPLNALEDEDEDDDDDDDFEFSLVRCDPEVTADEIFGDGQIRHVFPIFNRDLLLPEYQEIQDRHLNRDVNANVSTLRLPLKKLFVEDLDPPSSPSSSEADGLEGISPGTYCVWTPKVVEQSPSRCKKSSSTGSASKRWKLRDLLRRSNSDGEGSFVFLTPRRNEHKTEKIERAENLDQKRNPAGAAGKMNGRGTTAGGQKASSPTHELFYPRNRAVKGGEKRRSYLPYRQDLLGFFAGVNKVGRTFPPC